MRAFRFIQAGGSFRLVVIARTQKLARDYVKAQALSSLTHRQLKFIGRGHPPESERGRWVAACVREEK